MECESDVIPQLGCKLGGDNAAVLDRARIARTRRSHNDVVAWLGAGLSQPVTKDARESNVWAKRPRELHLRTSRAHLPREVDVHVVTRGEQERHDHDARIPAHEAEGFGHVRAFDVDEAAPHLDFGMLGSHRVHQARDRVVTVDRRSAVGNANERGKRIESRGHCGNTASAVSLMCHQWLSSSRHCTAAWRSSTTVWAPPSPGSVCQRTGLL